MAELFSFPLFVGNHQNYVEGNPINFTDPEGRMPCAIDLNDQTGWSDQAIDSRVDEAEKDMSRTSDPMDTYTAAGIAIQCSGLDNPFDPNSGVGDAQVSKNQAETEWGKPIYDYDIFGNQLFVEKNGKRVPVIRGYGLRLTCSDGKLEKALDPNNTKDAVVLMKRRIQLVTNACIGCLATDIFIAAALAQNGPGFSQIGMKLDVHNMTRSERQKYNYPRVNKNWFGYFSEDARDGDMVNTKIQLIRFVFVTNELIKRKWIVPVLDTTTINALTSWR